MIVQLANSVISTSRFEEKRDSSLVTHQSENIWNNPFRMTNRELLVIDYAKRLDRRGDLDKVSQLLNLPIDFSSGIQKLNAAGDWLACERKRTVSGVLNSKSLDRRNGTVL